MTLLRPFRNLGLKVLSIGVAVLLWMVVAGEETVDRSLRVPLELQQFPPGLELQSDVPPTVDVRVRGTTGALGRVMPGDIAAVLDLRGARPGRRLFQLNPDLVRAPAGVEVIQILPATVAMVLEPSASRQLPVVPDLDGKPAPGYVVGKTTTNPGTVEVVGPEGALKRATEAVTEPISVAGARDRVVDTVPVGVLNPALRLKNPQTATVTIEIVPEAPARVSGEK